MCGAPLASNDENVQPMQENWQAGNRNVSRSGQGQQELPAWLESLRAGEMPAAPPKSPSNFAAADLVEKGELPTWMHPERGETGEMPLRAAGFPSATTGEGGIPRQGLTASSLIDENALPTWMREGGKPGESAPLPQGFNASSLVDANALPEWMRNMQPQTPASSAPSQSSPVMPAIAQTPQPASTPSMPAAPQPSPLPQAPEAASAYTPGQGLTANSLIDPQSLPSWMKEGEQGAASAQSLEPGFSASSLVDANALPSWMRENGQPAQTPQAQPTGGQGPLSGNHPAAASGISASSFIDMNALPTWMREGEGAGQASVQGGMQRGAEGMRVPSRPRGEVNAPEGSEVAANVFASMLGVASVAPNYPGQPQAPQGPMQQQPGPANMGNTSPYMGGGGNAAGMSGIHEPMSPGMNQGLGQMPGQQPGAYMNSSALPGQGSMSGIMEPQQGNSMSGVYNNSYPYGAAPGANQNPYSMGGVSMNGIPQTPGGMPGAMPSQHGIGAMPEQPRAEAQKPAKRGLFNAIRELFFR